MSNNALHDNDDTRINECLELAMIRGAQIRRRRYLAQVTLAVLAVCAVIIPLGVLGRSSPSTEQAVNPKAFQLVSWSHVSYPGLTISNAQYPVEIGCGPGFPGMFPVDVQQVTYVRPLRDQETLALVLVKCESATPTPSSLYVFAPGRSAVQPHLLQVLLTPPSPKVDFLWYAKHFQVVGQSVRLPAHGLAKNEGPCCSDVSTTMRWNFQGRHLVRQSETIHTLRD